ncbi:multidrug effflux MFS transporter [Lentiprolixibacter aurantiacus]|uniref:Multidrug effflux MFS transporter n=1 Tax=Lentiprolixibacter aurantiacus TaxID=2993939 RepID=A0AAE3MLJ6_9FLAO|nr:multidrug effflux MFS transporter [Lentiprolixibacter aurantiacus]MCX2719638.1 multidrug effflux MFS transporter [Lentiprolixibacter aurantiacus]
MSVSRSSQIEFVALMAALMSIAALALDALLPALEPIGQTIQSRSAADNQLLITLFFLGLGVGPLVFGPISDSIGRKPVVYMGFGLFILSSMICVFARSVEVMIIGRILQGISLSAPRTISVAMIRDTYSGDYMARVMSFVTVVFILVPVVAPALGKYILDRMGWQAIFHVQVGFSILVCWWFWKRQAETLPQIRRNSFRGRIFIDGFKELLNYRQTVAFTFIWGFITGSFLVYLSTSQQVFEQQYGLPDAFPYLFAALAITIGAATLLNGTLVVRLGMLRLVTAAIILYVLTSLVYILLYFNSGNPPVIVLMIFFAVQFFAVGFIFGNLRSLAMEPLGHIAGIGAAITGFVATVMAVPISSFIGKFVLNSVLPMFVGFLVCGTISCLILGYYYFTKSGIRNRY